MADNERLAIIETKVDTLTTLVTDHATDIKSAHKDFKIGLEKLEARVRGVERFRNIVIGAGIVVSGGVTAFWRNITNL